MVAFGPLLAPYPPPGDAPRSLATNRLEILHMREFRGAFFIHEEKLAACPTSYMHANRHCVDLMFIKAVSQGRSQATNKQTCYLEAAKRVVFAIFA
ncbi:unnamed protein product [Angiostrongylus costaricensis]|uniref:PDEase domain-containing protein n=1 Tax=Angiostrongylus costaricensis TaxID=334426 RepID=A0A0R3PXS7_ANGCS|nr:unnamed protein product [Angiostrongylus costaricensis]